MNQKKAKALRKLVRASGENWRAVDYRRDGFHQKSNFSFPTGRTSYAVTGTITLAEKCGRAVYRGLKSVSASAFKPMQF